MIGTNSLTGSEISINMACYPNVAHDGSRLGVFGKSERNVDASLQRDGALGRISFSIEFGQKPKFLRGIVKIAFSSLAYFLGWQLAVSDHFDPARTFVRSGAGRRQVLLVPSSTPTYQNQAWPPYKSDTGYYAVTSRLAMFEFCVDLSPNLTLFPVLRDKMLEMRGDLGWTYLPIDA